MQFYSMIIRAIVVILLILFARWAGVNIRDAMEVAVSAHLSENPVEGSSNSVDAPLLSKEEAK